MQTGQQTIGEVSTGIGVTTITGARTVITNTNLDLMTIAVQPRSGSYSIDLGQTYIELSDSNVKVVMKYDSGSFVDTPAIDGDVFGVTFPADAQSFGVVVLQDADSSLSGTHPVLNSGDQVALTVNLDEVFPGAVDGIAPRTHVWGTIQSEQGAPGVFAFTTPSSYAADLVFTLY